MRTRKMKVKVTCGRMEWRVGSLTPVRPKSNASISLSGVGLTTAAAAEGFTPPTFKTTGSAILLSDRLFLIAFTTFILSTIIIVVLHFKYCAESIYLLSNVRLPKFDKSTQIQHWLTYPVRMRSLAIMDH